MVCACVCVCVCVCALPLFCHSNLPYAEETSINFLCELSGMERAALGWPPVQRLQQQQQQQQKPFSFSSMAALPPAPAPERPPQQRSAAVAPKVLLLPVFALCFSL
jgi:hypothetical protein